MRSLDGHFCVRDAQDDINRKESTSGGISMRLFAAVAALSVLLAGTASLLAQDNAAASVADRITEDQGAQVAALYRLQAAFHGAATVRDPVNGDSADVINERIRAMLSIWTDNGWILFDIGSPLDGYYVGNGNPTIPSTCPVPSGNLTNRGTLCTFFKYVAGPFQSANRFVSLAPSYKTEIHPYGREAKFYFECHFFNVAPDPATGTPLWAATGHLSFDGAATEVRNQWLFSRAHVQPVGIPVP